MKAVTSDQLGGRLMDDVTAVISRPKLVDRHAGHLRLKQIGRPEMRDHPAVPGRQAAVDVPAQRAG